MAPTPKRGQQRLDSFFSRTPAAKAKSTDDNKVAKERSTHKSADITKPHAKADDALAKSKTRLYDPKPANSRPGKNSAATSSSPLTSISSPLASPSGHDTPPTSDAIDVDMFSEEDISAEAKRIGKRKVVTDSEDEMPIPSSSSAISNSSPGREDRRGRAKKPRMSQPLSDDEDEPSASSFSQRLSKYQNQSKKTKSRSRSRSEDDDDDFIVPDDDSDAEMKPASSRDSSRSGRSLIVSEDESAEDAPKTTKRKAKAKSSSKTQAASREGNPNGGSFLTAAEVRRQAEKEGKKAAEEAYSFLQDVKDKDGKRPGEAGYDPRTLLIPRHAWNLFTPFEKQFWEIKQDHYDTVLFFQKGKFFELYEDDARIGHQEFDLKLTQRVKMSMVGVPDYTFDFWAAKFLAKGYKVGQVAQSETALGAEMRVSADKKKGKAPAKANEKIVQRSLHKVYTNGTLVDPQLLTDDEAGHCISIREAGDEEAQNPSSFGICVLDCSTSQFDLSAFEDDVCRTKLETMIRQLRPKEFLYTKGQLSVTTTRLLKSILPPGCLWTSLREVEGFDYGRTLKELGKIYGEDSGDDENMESNVNEKDLPDTIPQTVRNMVASVPAIEALGSMLWYLRQLKIDKDIMTMRNFNIYDPLKKGNGLVLDGQTLSHIEVLVNSEGTEDGTLLKLLGRCLTPFGKRLFRIWLCTPLMDVASINARLDAVEDIEGSDGESFVKAFKDMTHKLPDLERIVSRIHAKNCKVKDFLAALQSFQHLSNGLKRLTDLSEPMKSKTIFGLLRGAPNLTPHIRNVEEMFKPPGEQDKGNDSLYPKKGKNEEYDSIVKTIKSLEQGLDDELDSIAEETNLKVSWWHSGVGQKDIYLVETPVGSKNIPKDWTKHSGLKTKTRWAVPRLKEKIRKLQEARETQNSVIKAFKYHVYEEFDKDKGIWLSAVRVLAELDCLYSLAIASIGLPGEYRCRPEFVEGSEGFIDFEELTHPTVAVNSTKPFIANTVQLGGKFGKIALLTGPNMAGKSTLMRMTAAGVIMAQLGMKVPAKRARLCPVDSILTRMGAYDNMFTNSSTFKVELDECCKILRNATPRSLVILDELGRGTSTFDGMAIASAVLHELATYTLSLSFFATHYSSLTSDYVSHPNIRNMHMATNVNEEEREIVFLYKLIEGVAKSSFGTYVGKVAGVPTEIVERADLISKDFEKKFCERQMARRNRLVGGRLMGVGVQADFAWLCKIASGKVELEGDKDKKKEVLRRMKEALRVSMRMSG